MTELRGHDGDAAVSTTQAPVSMIGLGIMGAAIAGHLAAVGVVVAGYDRDTARLVALDATVASMLAAHAHSDASPCCDWLEPSTVSLACKQRNRERLQASGIVLLDCPNSGTGAQAQHRDLSYLCQRRRCAAVIAGYARENQYVGEFDQGTRLKLVAKLRVATHNVATAEAIDLAVRAGLSPTEACTLLGSGTAAAYWIIQEMNHDAAT